MARAAARDGGGLGGQCNGLMRILAQRAMMMMMMMMMIYSSWST